MSAPYRPGQPPWPENQPQRPDHPPPAPFHGGPAAGTSSTTWALRIVGLLAVAVISGVTWSLLTAEDPSGSPTSVGGGSSSTEKRGGEFEFTEEIPSPIVHEDCGKHAYGQIQDFLIEEPCVRLTRSIFSTSIDGRTVYTSVSVVEMPDKEIAKELRDLTDRNGSGNVNDLVREGALEIDGLGTLSSGHGYDSAQDGREVIIVESDYDPAAAKGGTEEELDRVCADAIRFAKDMVEAAG